MLLAETGFKSTKNQRFKIYLTNSLEEHHKDTDTLFANWLSSEANEANHIKRDSPVMVVMGNPPYSGISTNKGEWISRLIDDYKYVDGVHFNERKHWLNDDYVKFIRFGQHFIDKNGEGILAYINNHSFLDNPTFRGMRWHLLNSFDTIYIIDLHGNSKKKEVSPDGSLDKNVFDIQAGVSINLFIKTGKKIEGELAKVKHLDIWGSRDDKYEQLLNNGLNELNFQDVECQKPYYFFQPKSDESKEEYEFGFQISKLFTLNSVGIVTARDKFCIDNDLIELKNRILEFANNQIPDKSIISKYGLKDTSTFKLGKSRNSLFMEKDINKYYQKISYRPFDDKWIYYNNDIVERPLMKVMKHLLNDKNIGLVVGRQSTDNYWCNIQISKYMIDNRYHFSYKGTASEFPLYIYSENSIQTSFDRLHERTPNLNKEITAQIATGLNLTFTNEKEKTEGTFAPIDLLDYIYAVLHSPAYREKYKEFLKIDFPRVPYPTNAETFWQLVKLGGQLRTIHLLESPVVTDYITSYPIDGDNVVNALRYDAGRVYINQTQYFDNVPAGAWQFYIGGYQPAQKWLKDRKGRELSFEDIMHYQSVIVALHETEKLMQQIDEVGVEPVIAEVV